MANVQGSNCFERGQLLFSAAEQSSKRTRTKFNWKLITVPNVGHDNFKIAPVAANYLFGK